MKTVSYYLDSLFGNSIFIDEVGMKISPDHYSKIKLRLQNLETRAPSLSSINLKFKAGDKEITGELSVISVGKKFTSRKTGRNTWEIYKKLETDIDFQILKWKRNRFSKRLVDDSTFEVDPNLKGGYAV